MVTMPEGLLDGRAVDLLGDASEEVAASWWAVQGTASSVMPEMGLAAGDRPLADVEVMAGALAACEYVVASRMHAALLGGCLPLGERGGLLAARGWSGTWARRLARCGALAARFASVSRAWAAGIVTSEHVDAVARTADRFAPDELSAVVAQLEDQWGAWSPGGVARFVAAADRMLHPPPDPSPDEADAHEARSLSFSLLGDTVLLAGELPRVEGELVIAAIDALAERMRSQADHVPAAARRADALVQLVNDAHAAGRLPTRGGLPVALTVTLLHTACGDPLWQTSRGHLLTDAEARWAACDAVITPIAVASQTPGRCAPPDGDPPGPGVRGDAGVEHDFARAAERVAGLASVLLGTQVPLAVGRAQRIATPAQRRALAVRDGGCVIPGCGVPAEACQVHHLNGWAAGGATDEANCVLLCWAHHRQVDLRMWTIEPVHPEHPIPHPGPGAPPGTPWPGNNRSPWVIRRRPRSRWRL